MTMLKEAADVVVVGGGPGGAVAATFAAMRGARVVLLERDRFPRYRIGESLMVSTVQGVCRALGVLDELLSQGFVRKPGGVFRWGADPELWNISFTQAEQLKARNANYALHVERGRFDELLLNNARRKGVDVRESAAVMHALENEGRVNGVLYRDAEGAVHEIRARFVVDASGGSSRLFSLAGKRVYSQFFRNVALFCYFEGANRLPHPIEGGGINEAFGDGWMWFLPLTDRITSVGAVIGAEQAEKLRGDHEAIMRGFIDACPHIRGLLEPAQRMTEGVYGEYRVRQDFSYTNEHFWRPGLSVVGDAACFIDPLFTTGVHLATYSGMLAARSINAVLHDGVGEHAAFDEFEYRYRLEYELFYHFAVALYDMNQSDDGFWKSRKVASTPEMNNHDFVRLLTRGSDSGEQYFRSKLGIGERAQSYAHRLAKATCPREHAAISRAMAEEIHGKFQSASGARPFHLGFEDIRTMTWDRDAPASRTETLRPLVPSRDGLSWRMAG